VETIEMILMYALRLRIGKAGSSLDLLENGIVRLSREWKESRDMGAHLFQAVVDLLVEAGLQPEEVSGFFVETDVPEAYTSYRIAETVRRVYNYGVTMKTEKQE
jgi:hypothetical protein